MSLCSVHICSLVKCKIKFLHNFYRVILCSVSRVLFTFIYATNHNILLLFLFYLLFHHFCRTTFPCNKIKAMNMIKLHRTMHTYCTNVIFPVLILHYGYVRCNQRGTMSEGHARIYYHRDFPWLCNYLKINSFFFLKGKEWKKELHIETEGTQTFKGETELEEPAKQPEIELAKREKGHQ